MATQWSQQPYERSKSYQINNGTREKFKKPPKGRFFLLLHDVNKVLSLWYT